MSRSPSGKVHPYRATPMRVRIGPDSRPIEVGGRSVLSVREEWLVEDAWWSSRLIRRHYFEVVLEGGHNLTLFRSLPGVRWFSQRA